MTPHEMSERAMLFALRVIRMAETLPRMPIGRNIASQVVRAATSTAANYRASQRAKSKADFTHKIAIVLEEVDEAAFWIELTERAGLVAPHRLAGLRREVDELVRIFATMRRTARER